MTEKTLGVAGKIAHAFVDSKLTPLLIGASLLLGIGAVLLLPREEEPQIIVPMVDIFVQMPGSSAQEVEERVTKPMEKLLWEIPGVEYIYSTSSPGSSMTIVRFYVGENEEKAIVRLNQKLYANFDIIPSGVSQPLVKPRSIDDVPILALTLWSERYDHYTLRRIAAQLHDIIKEAPQVSELRLIGGQRRQIRVILDAGKLAAHNLSPAALTPVLQQANAQFPSGSFSSGNREFLVETGAFLRTAEDVGSVVIGVFNQQPVYLRDVAEIVDGPEEPANYVFHDPGPAAQSGRRLLAAGEEPPASGSYPAVTISIAKRKGANAIVVADTVLEKIKEVQGRVIPSDVHVAITRNYGATAEEKSNELLFHMLLAIISVAILIALALGLRESGTVSIAIPVTLALTLVVFLLGGYTLNRVTLFALIFSIGILVDDAIVVVENIVRHHRLPENHGKPLSEIAVQAVDEVGNPTILATMAVIASILPMAFVRGLMGPYMMPIPVGASSAMIFSVLVSFMVTPWACVRLLHKESRPQPPSGQSRTARMLRRLLRKTEPDAPAPIADGSPDREGFVIRAYRRVMKPLVEVPWMRHVFLGCTALLLLLAMSMVAFKLVIVKMLPFDNKSEFQIIIDMPEGSPLEKTAAVAREIGDTLRNVPEVTDYQTYVGAASPHNFNGLVRHYFMRRNPNEADLQVNLTPKGERRAQSHDIAKRVRPLVQEVAARHGARVKVAEVPPGPPVLQTLVAEIYGPDYSRQIEVARQIRDIFEKTESVVDVDWYVEDDQTKLHLEADREKAALNSVSVEQIAATLRMAVEGTEAGLIHQSKEKEDVPIVLRMPRGNRSSLESLKAIKVQGEKGNLVPLGELVRVTEGIEDKSIYHKNLMPVVYVTGDVAGGAESPVYAIAQMKKDVAALQLPEGYGIEQYVARLPFSSERIAMKWDGEWHITYEVFRDMGLAFAAVLLLIFALVVGWFQSMKTPPIIMIVIPFSLIGILPAHWLFGAFFTATSMIGFIAGAGIVVRNSIILVDFIELRMSQGMPLAQAAIDAGAVRFRPILLTAAAVVVGAAIILFDPIFQGVAISLMAGEVVSVFLAPLTVPLLYYMANHKKEGRS